MLTTLLLCDAVQKDNLNHDELGRFAEGSSGTARSASSTANGSNKSVDHLAAAASHQSAKDAHFAAGKAYRAESLRREEVGNNLKGKSKKEELKAASELENKATAHFAQAEVHRTNAEFHRLASNPKNSFVQSTTMAGVPGQAYMNLVHPPRK
jgi:hypothetical protein